MEVHVTFADTKISCIARLLLYGKGVSQVLPRLPSGEHLRNLYGGYITFADTKISCIARLVPYGNSVGQVLAKLPSSEHLRNLYGGSCHICRHKNLMYSAPGALWQW